MRGTGYILVPKLVGGIAKGHPNTQDMERARSFYREIKERLH